MSTSVPPTPNASFALGGDSLLIGRAPWLLMLAIALGQIGLPAQASAQNAEVAPAEQSANPLPAGQAATGPDVVYERGPDGQWRAIPVTEQSLPMIDDLLEPSGEGAPPVPDAFISRLTLEGRVIDDWAAVTAEVEIRVVTDERWLRVPLRFDQAHLLRYEHQGDGEAAPAAVNDANQGLTWMLRGRGMHTLILTLRVPLRKTTNGSQLQLVVPEMSNLFAGEMQLRLPGDQLAIQAGEDVHVLGAPRKVGGETIISATLAGGRVDLRWHRVVEEANPISQTLTHLTLRLRDRRVLLSARQELRLRQSGLAAVEVRLPPGGFEMNAPVRISDTSGAERQIHPAAAARDGWVQVSLDGVIGTAVRFDWSFEMPFEGSVDQLIVDGLEVAGAADQSGTIALEGFDRHVLTRQSNSGGGVVRIGVDELPAAGAFANLAYRFQAGNYRLVLDVDPLEPTFRVTPIYVLNLSELRTSLTAWFVVSIDEGQVDALSLNWPRLSEQGWEVEPLALGGGEVRRDEVFEHRAAEQSPPDESAGHPQTEESSGSRWLLKPAKPLGNGSEMGLSAERSHPSARNFSRPLEIVLPQIAEGRPLPGALFVTMSDDIEASIDPLPGVNLVPRSKSALVPSSVLGELEDRSQLAYELVPEDPDAALAINVAMTIQPRQVRMASVITLEQVDTDPRVTQTIDLDVSFGRLSSVRLEVPAPLAEVFSDLPDEARREALRFRLGSEPLPTTSVYWDGPEVELMLPEAMRGSFQLTIGPYTTPTLQNHSASMEVPIVSSVDRSFDSLKLVIPDLETVAVRIPDVQWTRLLTVVDGAEWMTRSSPEAVMLELDASLEAIPQQMSIPLAIVRSNVSESGVIRTVAQYSLEDDCRQVLVHLPGEAEPVHFEWGGQQVESPFLTEQDQITNQFLLERPGEPPGGRSWLTVTYDIRNQPLGWSRKSVIPFPEFGEGVAIERTIWEVKLPGSQHLLTRPKALSPQYSWIRDAIVWRRTPEQDYRDQRGEFAVRGAAEVFSVDASNVYPFETYGTLAEVSVRSMSNSLLVFLGAGLTLVASFLVVKVPQARSLWFWLFCGTVVALLSLWHLEAILLLLQPAAYGLVLPICAALFELITDRKTVRPEALSTRRSFELTLPSSDDSRPSAGSSFDPSMPSTLVRPTALSDSGVR